MDEILLVGAGGLGRESAEAIRSAGHDRVIGYLDEDSARWGSDLDGVPVIGGLDEVRRFPDARILLSARSGRARAELASRLAALGVPEQAYATLVHASVARPASCEIGPGSILLAGTVLTTNVSIGRHVVIGPGVALTHDDLVEAYATLGAGVSLGGHVWIGEGARLGMNACVADGVRVGRYAVLGMGAALTRHLPGNETWSGVPARPLDDVIKPGEPAVQTLGS